jgi:hypothetical protein
MERESQPQRFDGAPVSLIERVRRWLTPVGGRVADGLRLATINVVLLVGGLAAIGFVAFLNHAAGWIIPGSLLFSGFFLVLLLAAGCLAVSWRYAAAHERAARRISRDPDADIFGAVAALPFIVMAVALVGSGLLGTFFSIVTLDSGRFVDAIGRIGYGGLFTALSLGIIIVARIATD